MAKSIIVVQGSEQFDLTTTERVSNEFGWPIRVARDLDEAAENQVHGDAAAVLVDCKAVQDGRSWPEVIQFLSGDGPEVRLIVCHGFGDRLDWPQLCDAGVFHVLALPLREGELRQSLGFVWEAERRLAMPRQLRVVAAA